MRIAALSMHRWIDARDIRFWLAVFFVIRLYGITNPPLEAVHHWRQATVLMVARNFLEVDPDIFHPRIDFAGEKTGITGMEFPLLNYMIFLVAKLFGWTHWHGRLIVLLVSTLGVWSFHQVVRRYFEQRTALFAALILSSSLWFSYSRKSMPDVFALSLVLVALHMAARALDGRHRIIHWTAFTVLASLGVLSKLPAGCLLVVLGPMLARSSVPWRIRWLAAGLAAVAMIPVLLWYGWWVPHLVSAFGYWHFFMGTSLVQGARELLACRPDVLQRFWFDALRFSGFAAFLLGMVALFRRGDHVLRMTFGLMAAAFALVMVKSGESFCKHTYYVLPFVPMMALIAASGVGALRKPWVMALAVGLIMVEGIANQQHEFRLKPRERELLGLEPLLDRVSSRDDRIVINSGIVPTPMYFAHRKGWLATNEELARPGFLDSLAALGCRHAVIMHATPQAAPINWPVVAENAYLRIHSRPGAHGSVPASVTGRSPRSK